MNREKLNTMLQEQETPNTNIIDQVMSFPEAEQEYGLNEGILRKYIYQTKQNRTKAKLVEGVDYRKSGKTWIITREAMDRIYKK